MGMGFPHSTPATEAGLVLRLVVTDHGLKATALKQLAKIEWPVPKRGRARQIP
jgi:hypothetical protein